jgi:putative restriction endonuclease
MRAYIGVTDSDWFVFLKNLPHLEEINFWQPSGNRQFRILKPGELFLFKLHYPANCIVGGGFFAYSKVIPIGLAWDAFQQANGAKTLNEMQARVAKYRQTKNDKNTNYEIGCILLEQPFFLPESSWIHVPDDWSSNIVQGKSYDLSVEPGLSLWKKLHVSMLLTSTVQIEQGRYGEPQVITQRLGQGSFRVMVTEAYSRRCAITQERTLPALDAAHIKPYAESGQHIVSNGLLLRRDLHSLFDKGYITISTSNTVMVSGKIKEEFDNGRDYYRLQNSPIQLPENPADRPSRDYLEWHNSNIYLG